MKASLSHIKVLVYSVPGEDPSSCTEGFLAAYTHSFSSVVHGGGDREVSVDQASLLPIGSGPLSYDLI